MPGSPGLQRFEQIVVLVKRGEQNARDVRMIATQCGDELRAAHHRHARVHQCYVYFVKPGQAQCLGAASSLRHDVDAMRASQNRGQS